MNLTRYNNLDKFRADVLGLLMIDEVQNNLMISIVMRSDNTAIDKWLLATIADEQGETVLIAICTPPFNLLLFEPGGKRNDNAVAFLAFSLKQIGFSVVGVLAEAALACSFTREYCGCGPGEPDMTMVMMRLDNLAEYKRASGSFRMLAEDDLTYTPLWEQAFCEECDILVPSQAENKKRIQTRIGKDTHFIWEDGLPVAQAVYGRETPNGAIINWVYTPPLYRGRGYASSVVAELVKAIFKRGKSFCCLFADAANPTSRSIYSKLGFYDVCKVDEYRFDRYITIE